MKNNSIYNLDRASDMIDLAIEIQSQVYWKGTFYCTNSDEYLKWSSFWEYLRSYQSEGAVKVEITPYEEVTFLMK